MMKYRVIYHNRLNNDPLEKDATPNLEAVTPFYVKVEKTRETEVTTNNSENESEPD